MKAPPISLFLREILRIRCEFPKQEIAALLATLPAALDSAPVRTSRRALINEVAVVFRDVPVPELERIVKRLVSEWPSFRIQLRDAPIDFEEGVLTSEPLLPLSIGNPLRLAALLYELAGGAICSGELVSGKYSPIAELGEAGNELVQNTLAGRFSGDCRSFWRQWLKTAGLTTGVIRIHAADQWRIPRWLLSCGQPGNLLELTPVNQRAAPTRFAARQQFRIGRSRSLSDLPIQIRERGKLNSTETKKLGRVHVVGYRVHDGIGFRDGTGSEPSANGTLWNDAPLSSKQVEPIGGRGVLNLAPQGTQYRIEVIPLPSCHMSKTAFSNLDEWKMLNDESLPGEGVFGAVTFHALIDWPPYRNAIWLFSEVGFEVTAAGEFTWMSENAPSHAILHRHGGFWLLHGNDQIPARLEGAILEPGDASPLVSGQTLDLGATRFTVSVT